MYKGRSRQDWFSLVEGWRSSGLSGANFAKENHCNQHTLWYWIAAASKKNKAILGVPSAFVKLKVPTKPENQAESQASQLVRLQLGNNLALEIAEKVESPALLAAIILISGLMRANQLAHFRKFTCAQATSIFGCSLTYSRRL